MRRFALLLCTVLAAACDRGGEEPVPEDSPAIDAPLTRVTFTTDTAYVISSDDSIALHVELATTVDQQSFGLMDRDSLPQEAGMIFLYNALQAATDAFYMYRTRIPLDIAFFDSSGRIVSILQMLPCTSTQRQQCPVYSPGTAFLGALEVNRGWMRQHGIEVGDRIVLPGRVGG